MINHYEELVERIRGEVSDPDHLVEKALMAWDSCKKPSSEQGVYMDSVALNLHGLYSGLERIFELIAGRLIRICRLGTFGTVNFLNRCLKIKETYDRQ